MLTSGALAGGKSNTHSIEAFLLHESLPLPFLAFHSLFVKYLAERPRSLLGGWSFSLTSIVWLT